MANGDMNMAQSERIRQALAKAGVPLAEPRCGTSGIAVSPNGRVLRVAAYPADGGDGRLDVYAAWLLLAVAVVRELGYPAIVTKRGVEASLSGPVAAPPAPKAPDTLLARSARAGFEAYNAAGPNPGQAYDGRPVPAWDEIVLEKREQIHAKWKAAAAAIAFDVLAAVAAEMRAGLGADEAIATASKAFDVRDPPIENGL